MIVIPENGVYSQKYHGSKHLYILESQFGGYRPFSDTHIHFLIFNDSTIQFAGDTYFWPIPPWKWRHRQWSLGFIWPRPDQGKMLKETNAVPSKGLDLWTFWTDPLTPSWKFAMGMDLVWIWFKIKKGNLQEPDKNQAPPWFGFNKSMKVTLLCWFSPKTHWNENCLTSGSGCSSNEPGAPSTLRPRQWKWQPALQGLRPSKAWKGNLSPKRTCFPLQKQTSLLSHPRIWGAGSFCLFLWPQSVGMSSAGGLFDLLAVCEPASRGSHTHTHTRISEKGHPTQTALFQEWPLFLWWATSKSWKDLDWYCITLYSTLYSFTELYPYGYGLHYFVFTALVLYFFPSNVSMVIPLTIVWNCITFKQIWIISNRTIFSWGQSSYFGG